MADGSDESAIIDVDRDELAARPIMKRLDDVLWSLCRSYLETPSERPMAVDVILAQDISSPRSNSFLLL